MSRYRIISRTFPKSGNKTFYAQVRKWGIWFYVGSWKVDTYPTDFRINSAGYLSFEAASDQLQCYQIWLKDKANLKAKKKPKKQHPITKVEYEYEH